MQSAEAQVAQDLADFEAARIDPQKFSHREHLRVAFEMLRRCSFPETLQRFSAGLKLLAEKAGKPQLYHETKTVAFLALIAERRARGGEQTWDEFITTNDDLADKRCLERVYQVDQLESATARDVFILPRRTPTRGRSTVERTIACYAVVFALYIAWSSATTFAKAHGHDNHVALLASVEILAAVMFCFARTRTAALALLLAVFAVATAIEISFGNVPARFVYYAASALLVWWLTPSPAARSLGS